MMKIICYDKCSTCAKAKKQLKAMGIPFEELDVKKNPPAEALLLALLKRAEKPQKLFNTSGKVYREMELSKTLHQLTLEQMASLLSQNGMLIKRPILFDEDHLLVGYQEKAYQALQEVL